MNANELADELTKMFKGEEYDRLVHEIPDMLRQQQAEIESLKADPLMYMRLNPKQELTNEKITAIAKEIFKDYKNFHHYQIDFARAVIKEVSGK